MTAEKLKIKYPNSVEMINNLLSKDAFNHHAIRGDRTVHELDNGRYYYNDQGLHIRLFPSLTMIIQWFYGSPPEVQRAEETIINYGYSQFLSNIKDAEVWLDDDDNVDFCDFTNKDFTKEELELAKKEN